MERLATEGRVHEGVEIGRRASGSTEQSELQSEPVHFHAILLVSVYPHKLLLEGTIRGTEIFPLAE